MRWLLCFILTSRLIAVPFENVGPSTPDEIASLSANLLIDGYIAPLSGQAFLHETDLHIKAAQDLALKRTYVPPQILGRYKDKDGIDRLLLGKNLSKQESRRWAILPHLWAGFNFHSPHFQVCDPSGFVLEFEIRGNKGVLKTNAYGLSNLRQGEPDSTADLRNIEFWYDQDAARIIWPDGTERIYRKQSSALYRLEVELLPNGKALHYEYESQGLSKITSTDKTGKYTYAAIKKVGENAYVGSDGREAKFYYDTFEVKGKVKKGKSKKSISYRTSVLTAASNPIYSNSIRYNERSLLSHYDAKDYPVSFEYFRHKGTVARTQRLHTPSGSTLFSYDPPIAGQKGGWTKAEHGNGASVIYRFDQNLLLTAIENWCDGALINQKTFSYNAKQHARRIETRDGTGNLLIAHSYECDVQGNPTLEQIEGNFGVFSIKRTFTTRGRLIREERDDGLGTEYTYLENTRLPTSKTTLEWGNPLRKTSYFYDEANNLIEEAEEGRTRIRYILNTQKPHLHRVQWKEERDWEGQLIHKTHFIYDEYGNCSEEEHFGSDENLAYTIERTYDSKGNLLEETNPLGQTAIYQYDHRNRCIHEIPFSGKLATDRIFDAKGRLCSIKENDHITHFAYNAWDDLIEKTDYLGLKTSYSYHPVHHKPILIESSPTLLKITYDSFGREIERRDVYDATTRTRYNSYGSPIEIVDPDGGVESYQYGPNGLLTLQTDPDGLKTAFTYDALGRIFSKTVGSYATSYSYDAYNLTEEIDPQGIANRYKYDLIGRKIEEARADRETKFFYDSLGFLSAEERADRRTTYLRNQIGQMLEKSIDGRLLTRWTYDSGGLVATVVRAGIFSYFYDPYARLIETIDEEGAKTTISYEESDQVLVKTIRDPRNIETIETYNAHDLLLKREIPGSVLEEFEYDCALRLVRQGPLCFSYTPGGLRASMTEGGMRTTFWTYTPSGKLQTKIKPDGTVLAYEYNLQGELTKVGSREFRYDRNGRLIQGIGFSRTLDPFGNTLREEFSNGLWIESKYDDSNRPLERTLPDYSRISYEYEGPFLKTVMRLHPNGSTLYTHTYDQYNEAGLPLSETGLFQTTYGYDRTGVRRTSQINPYLKEGLAYDEAGNLIRRGAVTYTYDNASQLTSETNKFTARYDQHYNCIEKNGRPQPVDWAGQMQGLPYDKNGNLVKSGFIFDAFDQLISAEKEDFIYDAVGRRLQKDNTSYLYIDDEEIGSFESGKAKELKILGHQNIVAIEIENRVFAPVQDVQGTIRSLIDWKTKELVKENSCDAFGLGLTDAIPYAYAGKRYDAKTGLIYFGKRYYDPQLGRWLTPDPLGPIDHSNLYQYVFNNPFLYRDPYGESIGGYLLGLGEIILGGTIMASGFALEVITVGGFTLGLGVTTGTGALLMGHGLSLTTQHSQDISFEKRSSPPGPNPKAEGTPHTIIEIPGPAGQYTTHNGDGTWKQYRGSGKPHGPIPRPNVKENKNNPSPSGPTPGNPNVREPRPDEIPTGK